MSLEHNFTENLSFMTSCSETLFRKSEAYSAYFTWCSCTMAHATTRDNTHVESGVWSVLCRNTGASGVFLEGLIKYLEMMGTKRGTHVERKGSCKGICSDTYHNLHWP